jgi:nicotinamidase-related amidase
VTDGVLVVIDAQHVFADAGSPWGAPRFAEVHPAIRRLTAGFAGRVVRTRFVAPAEPTGAWVPYYETFPWALEPPDSKLYEFTDEVTAVAAQSGNVVTATAFGKWNEDLRAVVGEQPELVVGGVATDCCVISTVLAAADAGADITVVTNACAGSTDENHQKALDVMALYAPLVSFTTTEELLGGS